MQHAHILVLLLRARPGACFPTEEDGCTEGWLRGANCWHVLAPCRRGPARADGTASVLLAPRSRGSCSDTVASPCVLLPADIGLFRGGFLLALQLPCWRNGISVITLQIAS